MFKFPASIHAVFAIVIQIRPCSVLHNVLRYQPSYEVQLNNNSVLPKQLVSAEYPPESEYLFPE